MEGFMSPTVKKAGRCVRRANPDDRRSSIIELTPAGAEVLTAATTVFEDELEARLAAALSPRKLEQPASTVDALRTANAALS
jgi:DNA-binding MarR family transcriptional regulator